jgi:hypothetical protein
MIFPNIVAIGFLMSQYRVGATAILVLILDRTLVWMVVAMEASSVPPLEERYRVFPSSSKVN